MDGGHNTIVVAAVIRFYLAVFLFDEGGEFEFEGGRVDDEVFG
jgi:hypothetical protein